MKNLREILIVILFILFMSATGIVAVLNFNAPFSFSLILYDVLFVLFMFVFPRIFGEKVRTEEDGMKDWYLFSGQAILIALGYYVVTFVYKL